MHLPLRHRGSSSRQPRFGAYLQHLGDVHRHAQIAQAQTLPGWFYGDAELYRCSRDQVFARLRAAGIGVNVHYIPIPAQPYYRGLGHDPAAYPGAQAYYQGAISLPLFPALTLSEQQQVVDALEQALCG